jgi:Ni/Fe-hydrogenase subunit HybB-like protein
LYDVGRPLRLPYPFFVQQGTTSVMFEVGACVAFYLTVLFLEWCPAPLEWLGFKNIRKVLVRMTLVLTIFGIVLSTLHQASLGALFLLAPSKMHPLWYSGYLPIFFFISAIAAGLAMVIFESTLAQRYFSNKMDSAHKAQHHNVTFGFGKAAAVVLAGYFAIKVIGVSMGNHWHLLFTGWGVWFLVEMLGFVALPSFLFMLGTRDHSIKIIRWAAVLTVLGIVLNRLNICLIAFNYHLPWEQKYLPHWQEIGISVFIVTLGLLAYRFIVTNMPILHEHPEYKEGH